jgi:dihydroxy-acid dehydratase
MEAGKVDGRAVDLIDIMIESADTTVDDDTVDKLEHLGCPTCGSCSGMFTANSMNSLTEALGLSLPGNGTIVSTHTNRRELFKAAARQIVNNAYAYYRDGDTSVLPRSIATRQAMLNAMTMDIAMGGSTNTVLHLLAVANEAKADFTVDDIDKLSLKTPVLCKVAPNSHYHIEDVNRAGGILAILKQLADAGLVDTSVKRVDGLTLAEAIKKAETQDELWRSAPGGVRTVKLGSQSSTYKELDHDRENGCIRDIKHAYTTDGGLAVLHGNIAKNGCVVKTAGVDSSIWKFSGPARVFTSQEATVDAILGNKINKGDVLVITYEGPKGGPGMQEMLYPTSYLKARHLGRDCALITDGRFSGGTSGLSIGHISPEAAAGGEIALIEEGDIIDIDIPARTLNVRLTDEQLAERRRRQEARGKEAYTPAGRDRHVSRALRAYAASVTSADKGGVRSEEV